MFDRGWLHARNGHRRRPWGRRRPAAELLSDVHHLPRPGDDTASPGVRRDGPVPAIPLDAFLRQAAAGWDGLRTALPPLLARTGDALRRGELADLRGWLAALRAEARRLERRLRDLALAVGVPMAGYRLVDLNRAVAEALVRARTLDRALEPRVEFEPGLPPVAGEPARLEQAFLALVLALRREEPWQLTVRTCVRPGVLAGQRVVRVVLELEGATAEASGALAAEAEKPADPARPLGLATAAWILREHGGVLVFRPPGEAGGGRVTVEFPTP